MGAFPGDSLGTITSEREYQIVSVATVAIFHKTQRCRYLLPSQASKKLCGCTEEDCGERLPHQRNSTDSDDKLCIRLQSDTLRQMLFSGETATFCSGSPGVGMDF